MCRAPLALGGAVASQGGRTERAVAARGGRTERAVAARGGRTERAVAARGGRTERAVAARGGRTERAVAARGGRTERAVAARGGRTERAVAVRGGRTERAVAARGGRTGRAVAAGSGRGKFALALGLLAFSSVAAVYNASEACFALWEDARQKGTPWRSARVALAWRSAPARAAAAALRAVLLAAGHRPADVALCELADDRLCALYDRNPSCLVDGQAPDVAVVVAATWAPAAACALYNDSTGLQVLGIGLAPAAPSLHARLPSARQPSACMPSARLPSACMPSTRLTSALTRLLRSGDVLSDRTEVKQWENATVYTIKGQWEKETAALCSAGLSCEAVSRAELAGLVDRPPDAERAFLFFDAALWADRRDVLPLPADDADREPLSLLAITDVNRLLQHATPLYNLLLGQFAPSGRLLRHVLEAVDVELAACALVPGDDDYYNWRMVAASYIVRQVVAIVCDDDDPDKIGDAAQSAIYYVGNETNLVTLKSEIKLKYRVVDCSRPSALTTSISDLYDEGTAWRTVGIAVPGDLASAAVTEAEKYRVPLIAYSPAPPEPRVHSATGGPAQLAKALRALLAVYDWKRVGLVSDGTPLARAIAAELCADEELLVRNEDADPPKKAVDALRERDTRVFFVNCDAAAAARVLEAAAEGAAAAAGEMWIVRDYRAADASTHTLRPLSVSFQWRGGRARVRAARGRPHRALAELAQRWGNDTWPRRAAALVDALVTIGVGFERLILARNDALDHPFMENKTRYFWERLQNWNITGIVENLEFNERGEINPSPYYDRWTEEGLVPLACCEARPAGVEPVWDGRRSCVTRVSEAYEQSCSDGAWLGGAAALAALGLAALAARRWLARRDRRLEHATTARVLARREAAFAELAPHLVPADALLLGEELGAGRFGRVRRCEIRREPRRRLRVVAAKTLRDDASPAEESQFLREARLLAALSHDHVVRFEGVSWEGGPPLLLMELALFGDLLRYLRARRHLAGGGAGPEAAAVAPAALTRLAREAAEALAYLGARGLVHRDVRAANCLVDARRSLKLADFGLARETGAADGEYACRGRALFPVLWMAPESLERGVATAASDAWSFGVLALELVTLGARPFGGAAPEACVRAVLAGGRPPLPRDACAETRALALACWRREPAARPPAARLAAWLARRPTALRPALAPDLEEPDCDSGIGEPDSPRRRTAPATRPAPALTDSV